MNNYSTFSITSALLILSCVFTFVFLSRQPLEQDRRSTNVTGDLPNEVAAPSSPFSTVIQKGSKASSEVTPLEISVKKSQLPNADISDRERNETTGEIESLIERFSSLMFVDSPNFSFENKIAVENELLELFRHDLNAMSGILSIYDQTDDYDQKFAVIDIVSMIEHPDIEQFALNQIDKEINDYTTRWLQILQSTGISSAEDRSKMLNMLDTYTDPVLLSNALSALIFQPLNYSESGKKELILRVEVFLTHENAEVRNAALRVVQNWSNS